MDLGGGMVQAVRWGMGWADDLRLLTRCLLQCGLAPSSPWTGSVHASGLGTTALIPLRSGSFPAVSYARLRQKVLFGSGTRGRGFNRRPSWAGNQSVWWVWVMWAVTLRKLHGLQFSWLEPGRISSSWFELGIEVGSPNQLNYQGSPVLMLLDWKSQEGRENTFYYSHYLIHVLNIEYYKNVVNEWVNK